MRFCISFAFEFTCLTSSHHLVNSTKAMLDRDHVMMRAEVLAVMMEFVKAVKAPILEMTVGELLVS